jgi:hypothetical protein
MERTEDRRLPIANARRSRNSCPLLAEMSSQSIQTGLTLLIDVAPPPLSELARDAHLESGDT